MPTIGFTIRRRLAALGAVTSLALGACSDDDSRENASTEAKDAGSESQSDAAAEKGLDAATKDAATPTRDDAATNTKTDAAVDSATDAGRDSSAPDDNDDDAGAESYPGANLERPPAPAADSACAVNGEGVQTVERPMFPKRADSPKFGYSFKVYPGTDPSAPTVIYVPGGPGSPSIEPTRSDDLLPQVPPELTIIATDPRGVGCNAPSSPDYYPAEFYNSEYSADDILGIVEKLELDHYIVYGLSYGTMLSTLVVSRAEARGLPLPKAVLLEGVFGRVFTGDVPSSEVAFQERWKETLAAVPESVQEQFTREPLPFDLTADQWGTVIETTLPLAALPSTAQYTFLEAFLLYLQPGVPEDTVNMGKATLTALSMTQHADDFGFRIHHELTCHELADNDFNGLTLVNGEVAVTSSDCGDVDLDRPYSAADWPISVPIYYLSGTADPNTPPWQAQFHFASQTKARRTLVHVDRAGHNPFGGNLAGDGTCLLPLWAAIDTGENFEQAITACKWPVEIETADAE